MSSATSLNQLLQKDLVWKVSAQTLARPALSTGYRQLDRLLYCGGWPQSAVSEILLSHNGSGEIRLLSPILAKLSQQSGYICWIDPPFLPYAPALARQGIHLDKLLIVRSQSTQQMIWATQQAMASKSCSAVLAWLPPQILVSQIRKLNLAAKAGNCWGFIFRSQSLQAQASPAALRVVLEMSQRQHHLSIIKQPGGWSGQQLCLDLFPEQKNWSSLAAEHWPTFSPKSNRSLRQSFKPAIATQSIQEIPPFPLCH